VRPGEVLVLKVANLAAGRPTRRDENLKWEFLWTFALQPVGSGGTRLLVRERVAFDSAVSRVLMAPLGLASFVMTRRMMLGIKSRAERSSRHQATGHSSVEELEAPGQEPEGPTRP
jgi:hypothetical protein